MISLKPRKKNIVMLPEEMLTNNYTGALYGKHFDETGVFNVYDAASCNALGVNLIGEIIDREAADGETDDGVAAHLSDGEGLLVGVRSNGTLEFSHKGQKFEIKPYSLVQNVFSRNTGILETGVMTCKSAVFLGCGSVGSFIALELAKAGVGKFLLIDNDIFEYHNICRHQCSIEDVGDFKVNALERRILAINPYADVLTVPKTIETTEKTAFDRYCQPSNGGFDSGGGVDSNGGFGSMGDFSDDCIIIGGADNRAADAYANSLAAVYNVPFISIGCWERAFAGEIFYWLPNKKQPCYRCALGAGNEMSQRQSANRRIYTHEEDLAKLNFMPGISADINFINIIAVKLIIDILNRNTLGYVPRLLSDLKQFTLICNTNNSDIGGEMAEIFSYPLQVTTSLEVGFSDDCPICHGKN